MTILNETNERTEKVIHLLVTTLCDRNCKYCCNKQYDLNDIPQVTHTELKKAEVICITGGEPFIYSNPNAIAGKLKVRYPNIQKVYVYTNACELYQYMTEGLRDLSNIDGLNISVKTPCDSEVMGQLLHQVNCYENVVDNRIYVFNNLYEDTAGYEERGYEIIHREWQKEFQPANDSIFRRI